MKKIIALVVAIVMIAAMAVPAFAANFVADSADVGGTQIIYGATQSYTVTIPSSIILTTGEYSEAQEVEISNYKLSVGMEVALSIDSAFAEEYYNNNTDGGWYLVEAYEDAEDNNTLKPKTKGAEDRTAKDVAYSVFNSATGTHNESDSVNRGAEILDAESAVNPQAVTTKLVFHTVGTSEVAKFTDIVSFTAQVKTAD